jgi:hypothetical protein
MQLGTNVFVSKAEAQTCCCDTLPIDVSDEIEQDHQPLRIAARG